MENSKTIDVVIDAPYGHSLGLGITIYLLNRQEIKIATIEEIRLTGHEQFIRTSMGEKLDLLDCGVTWSPYKEDIEQTIEDLKNRQLHFGDKVNIKEGLEGDKHLAAGKDGILVFTEWPTYYNAHSREPGQAKFLYTVAVENVGTLNFFEDEIKLIQKTNAEYYLDYAENQLVAKLKSRIYDLQKTKKPAELIKILNTELEDGTYLSYNKRKDK